MKRKINSLKEKFKKDINGVDSLDTIEHIRIQYLGRKGSINTLLKQGSSISGEDRKQILMSINELKDTIVTRIESKHTNLVEFHDANVWTDSTLPGKNDYVGVIHPLSKTIARVRSIFTRLGFAQLSYREIDWEYFCFDALNMPPTHPARDTFESFCISGPSDKDFGRATLTPHTSNGQVREMLRVKKPPIRMINIGRCYRRDLDTTHTPTLHQFEGMEIDIHINISHLKWTIEHFVREFFGPDTQIRLRPHHFQFTEPSFEVDITCDLCHGKGTIVNQTLCKVCKSGWLELGGSGIIHPRVLKEGGIDNKKYSGWAFGFGIERVLMMKIALDDIRKLYGGQLRQLRSMTL